MGRLIGGDLNLGKLFLLTSWTLLDCAGSYSRTKDGSAIAWFGIKRKKYSPFPIEVKTGLVRVILLVSLEVRLHRVGHLWIRLGLDQGRRQPHHLLPVDARAVDRLIAVLGLSDTHLKPKME